MKLRKKIIAFALSLSLILSFEILPQTAYFRSNAAGHSNNKNIYVGNDVKIPENLRGSVEGTVFHVNTESHSISFSNGDLKINWNMDGIRNARGIVIPYVIQPINSMSEEEFIKTLPESKKIKYNIFKNIKVGVMLLRDFDNDGYVDGDGDIVDLGAGENTLKALSSMKSYIDYMDKKDVDDDNDGIANQYDVEPKNKNYLYINATDNDAVYTTTHVSDNVIATSTIQSINGSSSNSDGPVKFNLTNLPSYFKNVEINTQNSGNKSEVHLKAIVDDSAFAKNEKIKKVIIGKLHGVTVREYNGYTNGMGEVQDANVDRPIIVTISKTDATQGNPLNPKIEVNDKNNLTKEEKKKVEDGVKKANPGAKDIKVENDGSTTFKDKNNKEKYLDQKDTVKEKSKGNDGGHTSSGKKPELPPNDPRNEGTHHRSTHRVSGTTRYGTAAEVSKAAYPNGAEEVILSNSNKFSDVLTAVPYGKVAKAPILYVDYNRMPKETLKEMNRLGAKRVILVGGNQTISPEMANKIKEMGLSVSRIGGKDRYETAKMIGERVRALSTENKKDVIIASGEVFPDALSISPLALRDETPILLCQKNKISKYTVEAMKELSKGRIYISGGVSTITNNVAENLKAYTETGITRFAGQNRYDTSVAIAKAIRPEAKISVFTSGEIFQDALVAGEMVNKYEAPLMLVKKSEVPSGVANYVKESKISRNIVVGGKNTVSDNVISILEKLEER